MSPRLLCCSEVIPVALKKFLNRLTTPVQELDRAALVEWSEESQAVSIDRISMRKHVFVAGEISSVRLVPRANSAALEVTVKDGRGTVTAIFLGRRTIPGLTTGRRLMLEGVPFRQNARVIFMNPVYRIIPRSVST